MTQRYKICCSICCWHNHHYWQMVNWEGKRIKGKGAQKYQESMVFYLVPCPWSVIMMNASIYFAYIYDAANFCYQQTDKAILGVGWWIRVHWGKGCEAIKGEESEDDPIKIASLQQLHRLKTCIKAFTGAWNHFMKVHGGEFGIWKLDVPYIRVHVLGRRTVFLQVSCAWQLIMD